MITADGPKLIEYNVRFGDPGDAGADDAPASPTCCRRCSPPPTACSIRFDLRWHDDAALTVVMAANGYPGTPEVGTEIRGLEAAAAVEGVQIFHAGTRRDGDRLLAHGGRVLNVTARGRDRRRGAGARLCRRRPHRLAGRLLSPRHRLARHRAREGERRASGHAAAPTIKQR